MTKVENKVAPSVPAPVKTTDLKEKFQARSIPLEKDFHDLIDMADAGRLAAGLSPEQDGTKDSAKTGLILDADKRLAVRPKENGGLEVATDGVSVNKGNGIDADADAVTVKAKSDGGLVVAADGVSINKGNGIDADADAVTVKAKAGGGLVVSSEGVEVDKMLQIRIMAAMLGNVQWYAHASGATLFVSNMAGETIIHWVPDSKCRPTVASYPTLYDVPAQDLSGGYGTDGFLTAKWTSVVPATGMTVEWSQLQNFPWDTRPDGYTCQRVSATLISF